jgi:hypothetical protein
MASIANDINLHQDIDMEVNNIQANGRSLLDMTIQMFVDVFFKISNKHNLICIPHHTHSIPL